MIGSMDGFCGMVYIDLKRKFMPFNTANRCQQYFWSVLSCHQGTGVRSMRGMHGTARDGLKDFASDSDILSSKALAWNRGMGDLGASSV